jgi:hypothetical protein
MEEGRVVNNTTGNGDALTKPCTNGTPPWFHGHWRDWHRGHGCDVDDGKPRSERACAEIAQHEASKDTGYLTDAELSFLRARTTSGDTLLVRALDELKVRRSIEDLEPLVRRWFAKQWWYSAQMSIDEVIIRASERLSHDHEEKCGTVVELLRDARAKLAKLAPQPAPFDHSGRTAKHFEPLLGYCVCKDCKELPC